MLTQWKTVLSDIKTSGHKNNSRVGAMTELVGYSFTLESVNKALLINDVRRISPFYACAEMIWYLCMDNNTSFLQLFAPSYNKYTEDGIHAFGAYGHRWSNSLAYSVLSAGKDPGFFNQLETAVSILRNFPDSRQAIVSMWDSGDLIHAERLDKKDLPCTLNLQFLLRNDKLNLVTFMRSNDVWLGLPYDSFCFTTLQRMVAEKLGVEVGKYVHNVGSMHYYARNEQKILQVLDDENDKDNYPEAENMPYYGNLSFRELGRYASDFVYGVYNDKRNCKLVNSLQPSTLISDLAFVCASYFNPDYIDEIYCPRLRMSVELFLKEKE